ncbi:hypothetical protein AciPR4_0569 [Terriglobus saanensis SP1PR4]|uniref:Uncharacterized protein n=1 Tax=Terriglobus saanensis (strain ATCC BAA-1853 / DSM 23119 / SP1PR4) TaxID=401053 RepID=E8V3Z0_TERSS|nr:hypothetical protein AciPR4_0569 [Terriglobus saanensis SP1PR4]
MKNLSETSIATYRPLTGRSLWSAWLSSPHLTVHFMFIWVAAMLLVVLALL